MRRILTVLAYLALTAGSMAIRAAEPESDRNMKTLVVPRGTDAAGFQTLMADRTDWLLIVFNNEVEVDDAWMELIARCENLISLEVGSYKAPLTPRGLGLLARCSRLRSLKVTIKELDDDCLVELAAGCPKVGYLHITTVERSHVGETGFRALAAFSKMLSLNLNVAGHLGDEAFAETVVAWPELTTLRLFNLNDVDSGITAEGLSALSACPDLERVEISLFAEGGDEEMIALARAVPKLRCLVVTGAANITDRGVLAIAANRKIQCLDLAAATGLTDAGLAALADCPELYCVRAKNSRRITPDGVVAFREKNKKALLELPVDLSTLYAAPPLDVF